MIVDPPIVSRIFQELNQGHVSYLEALALARTPYPLPLSQMANIVVFLFALFYVPVQFSATIASPYYAVIFSFLCTVLFYGVQETARELEDPVSSISHSNCRYVQINCANAHMRPDRDKRRVHAGAPVRAMV